MKKTIPLLTVLVLLSPATLLAMPPDSTLQKITIAYKKPAGDNLTAIKDVLRLSLLAFYWDSTDNTLAKKQLSEVYYQYNKGGYNDFKAALIGGERSGNNRLNDFNISPVPETNMGHYLDSVIIQQVFRVLPNSAETPPPTIWQRLPQNIDLLLLGIGIAIFAGGLVWFFAKKIPRSLFINKPKETTDAPPQPNAGNQGSVQPANQGVRQENNQPTEASNNLETGMVDIQQMVSSLTTNFETRRTEHEKDEKIIAQLHATVEKGKFFKEKIDALDKEVTELRNKNSALIQSNQILTGELHDKTEEYNTLEQKKTSIEDQINSAKSELTTNKDHLDSLKNKINKIVTKLYGDTNTWQEFSTSKLLLSFLLLRELGQLASGQTDLPQNIPAFLQEAPFSPGMEELDIQNKQAFNNTLKFIKFLKKNNIEFPPHMEFLYFPEKTSLTKYNQVPID